jgi:hypothetical protein
MDKKRVHNNKVCGYLKPKQDALFRGFVQQNEISHSEAINIMVKDFFSRLPAEQKINYLSTVRTNRIDNF